MILCTFEKAEIRKRLRRSRRFVNDSFDRFLSRNRDRSQFIGHSAAAFKWQTVEFRFAASVVGRREKSAGYRMAGTMFKRQFKFGVM